MAKKISSKTSKKDAAKAASKAIVDMAEKLVKEIKKGQNPHFEVPVRALSNVNFNQKTRTLELGQKTSERQLFNASHIKKFLQTLEVARAAKKELIDTGKHETLRGMYYMTKRTIPGTKIDIVDEQKETDKAIEDLELITGFSREQLHMNAKKSGSVAGKVVVEDRGDTIDWGTMGSGGWAVPSNVEEIKFKKVTAKFIIYMEKDAVWERLNEDKVWEKLNCVIMASSGQTTRGIRRLLQRLHKEHNLPIYVLTDFDPWGFYIYSVIKYGSISLAHMAGESAIPGAKFLGITAEDVEKYKLQKIKMADNDFSRLKQISEYDWFKDDKKWQKQFKAMKQLKNKVEIDALKRLGVSFISDTYLPEKIKNKDWLD